MKKQFSRLKMGDFLSEFIACVQVFTDSLFSPRSPSSARHKKKTVEDVLTASARFGGARIFSRYALVLSCSSIFRKERKEK